MTLRRHKLRNHVPRQSWGYRCPYCSETYMEPASYQQHVLHLGRSATFGCRHGGCTFTTKSSKHLCDHIKKHRIANSRNSIYNHNGQTTSRKAIIPRYDTINLAAYLIDDELGSGNGKETLVPILTHNFKDVLSMSEKESFNKQFLRHKNNDFSESVSLNKDFLKTPINLNIGKNRAHFKETTMKPQFYVNKDVIVSHRVNNYYVGGEFKKNLIFLDFDDIYKVDNYTSSAKVDWIAGEIEIEDFVEQPLEQINDFIDEALD